MRHLVEFVAASGGGEEVGKNVGKLLQGWATWLYTGITAIVACMFLFNRRFAELAVFVGAAVIVGGFVLDPNGVHNTVKDIWSSVAPG